MPRKKLFSLFLKNKNNLSIRNQLIEVHTPLVYKIVNQFKYYPSILTKADLVQEGFLGLIRALGYYQDQGYDFIAYARPTIKFVIRELSRHSHIPLGPQKNSYVVNTNFQETIYYSFANYSLDPHQNWLNQVDYEFWVQKIKQNLNASEFKIIGLSFGFFNHFQCHKKNSYREIALYLQMSPKKVQKIRKNALQKLKRKLKYLKFSYKN
ncbi:MAG: sigma-70 family RNA polymerase sigma factor [Candidatus Phytoplasma australasiaticum]|nr:sigma-70 family RNA polymerase sigma factor [Candidatus Phytoplasma australasiaticum]